MDYEGISAKAWRAAVGEQLSELQAAGLKVTDLRNIYVDVTPNTAAMAEGLASGDLSEPLSLVAKGLDVMKAASPLLDKIYRKASA